MTVVFFSLLWIFEQALINTTETEVGAQCSISNYCYYNPAVCPLCSSIAFHIPVNHPSENSLPLTNLRHQIYNFCDCYQQLNIMNTRVEGG